LNTRYETERDIQDLHEPIEQDREISLGTTTILGIFFALALLCTVFFGFGYSLGSRSTSPKLSSTSEDNTAKLAPGNQTTQATTSDKPSAGAIQSAVVPIDSSSSAAQDAQQTPAPSPAKEDVASPRPDLRNEPAPKTATKPAAVVPVAATPSSSGPVVQVAAMSHQEDADVVAADLKRRGYTVAIRRVPQDKLFHVQIGPFSTRKEADTMRQRLQTDGYNNAIVK
jgi:DedD protein